MIDSVLVLLYAAAALLSYRCMRQPAVESLCVFAVISALSTFTVSLPWPWVHFAILWLACFAWSAILVNRCALLPALAVGGCAVFMIVMAIDRLLWPEQSTALYQSYEHVVVALNLLIIGALIWYGRHGDRVGCFGRRRNDRLKPLATWRHN